ncbi:MAG: glutathione transferase GstA [Moraxellaceae bacterium]|nr:glutathione transferase GstA [Moraxellaceae bacterium]MDZ4387754.1 glutathione transferase GstA [Moraxellaceae bacterium]
MKLYFSPGVCSLSSHIILQETGIEHDLIQVDLPTHRTADGGDFYQINPKGSVPVLALENGLVLTEGVAIMQFLADKAERYDLLPPVHDMKRYQVLEWLNYIGTELHKSFYPLFNLTLSPNDRELFIALLNKKFAWLNEQLKNKSFLLGDSFCLADAYLFTVSNWCDVVGVSLSELDHLQQYRGRVRQRPAVSKALSIEASYNK